MKKTITQFKLNQRSNTAEKKIKLKKYMLIILLKIKRKLNINLYLKIMLKSLTIYIIIGNHAFRINFFRKIFFKKKNFLKLFLRKNIY